MKQAKPIFFSLALILLGTLEIRFPHILDSFFDLLSGFRGWPGVFIFLPIIILWLTWNKVGGFLTLATGIIVAIFLIKSRFFNPKINDSCSNEEVEKKNTLGKDILILAAGHLVKRNLVGKDEKSV